MTMTFERQSYDFSILSYNDTREKVIEKTQENRTKSKHDRSCNNCFREMTLCLLTIPRMKDVNVIGS